MANLEDWIIEQGLRGSRCRLAARRIRRAAGRRGHSPGPGLSRPADRQPDDPRLHPCLDPLGRHDRRGRLARAQRRVPSSMSPFAYMMKTDQTSCYWLIDDPEADEVRRVRGCPARGRDGLSRPPLQLREHQRSGPARHRASPSPRAARKGFSPEEIARIDALLPLLGLAAYRMTLFDLTVAMLDTYVGLSAGRRVLSGEIRRGFGTTLTAALLFADLRGFTTLADTAGINLIARLDQHLEAMADPVAEQGGEVLKFMGDGVLAAFPITEERSQRGRVRGGDPGGPDCARAQCRRQPPPCRRGAAQPRHRAPLRRRVLRQYRRGRPARFHGDRTGRQRGEPHGGPVQQPRLRRRSCPTAWPP